MAISLVATLTLDTLRDTLSTRKVTRILAKQAKAKAKTKPSPATTPRPRSSSIDFGPGLWDSEGARLFLSLQDDQGAELRRRYGLAPAAKETQNESSDTTISGDAPTTTPDKILTNEGPDSVKGTNDSADAAPETPTTGTATNTCTSKSTDSSTDTATVAVAAGITTTLTPPRTPTPTVHDAAAAESYLSAGAELSLVRTELELLPVLAAIDMLRAELAITLRLPHEANNNEDDDDDEDGKRCIDVDVFVAEAREALREAGDWRAAEERRDDMARRRIAEDLRRARDGVLVRWTAGERQWID